LIHFFLKSVGEGKFGTQREFFEKKVDPGSVVFDANMPPLVWGVKYEPVACMLYCKRNRTNVQDFGLLKHPTIPHIGASPDGISADGIMVEIKCPWRRVPDGTVPKQYMYQIQFQLDVCDLDECDYLEVKLAEYDDEAEFVADAFIAHGTDAMYSANGNEKGVLIEYVVGADRKYEYNDVVTTATVAQALEWRDAALASLPADAENVYVTYWRVETLGVIRVYRDREFLEAKYPEIEAVWEKVVAYRADRGLYEQEVVSAKKTRAKKVTATYVRSAKQPEGLCVPVCCLGDD